MTKKHITNKVLTRKELTDRVYNCVAMSRQEAAGITDTFIQTIVDTLAAGENVNINNFAVFIVRRKNARLGRNPKTMQSAVVGAHSAVLFRPSTALRRAVNAIPISPATADE